VTSGAKFFNNMRHSGGVFEVRVGGEILVLAAVWAQTCDEEHARCR
jgi:hypothetical protein